MPFKSTKIFTGYSTAFRQHRATDSHCRFLHGYSLKFKVTFVGDLDDKNWVMDFGCFKKNGIKEYLNFMFDHTTIVAKDDPNLSTFGQLEEQGIIQLRVLNNVGCEKFAEYVFNYIAKELDSVRVKVESVECIENDSNSATYNENRSGILPYNKQRKLNEL